MGTTNLGQYSLSKRNSQQMCSIHTRTDSKILDSNRESVFPEEIVESRKFTPNFQQRGRTIKRKRIKTFVPGRNVPRKQRTGCMKKEPRIQLKNILNENTSAFQMIRLPQVVAGSARLETLNLHSLLVYSLLLFV